MKQSTEFLITMGIMTILGCVFISLSCINILVAPIMIIGGFAILGFTFSFYIKNGEKYLNSEESEEVQEKLKNRTILDVLNDLLKEEFFQRCIGIIIMAFGII